MLGTTENKPSFLSDKQLEPALRLLLRRFPNIDTKAGAVSLELLTLHALMDSSLWFDTINLKWSTVYEGCPSKSWTFVITGDYVPGIL